MGGGLLQLVAYGAQDVYLTGNPQITFFKVVYRRHTNFSMEAIEQSFNGTNNFGSSVSVLITRNGDLINRIYFHASIFNNNSGSSAGSSSAVALVPSFGLRLLKSVELEIGGQRIDKHYSEWLYIWNELTLTAGRREVYKIMTGGDVKNRSILLPQQTGYNINVPLEFWFCRNIGLALPLIALQYHEVKINITYANASELVDTAKTNYCNFAEDNNYLLADDGTTQITTGDLGNNRCAGSANNLQMNNVSLWVDYIFLDTDERRRFAQLSHEYLIEQLQFTGSDSVTATTDPNSMKSVRMTFNHPCKELIWTIRNTNNSSNTYWNNFSTNSSVSTATNVYETSENPVMLAKIQLNGNDRMTERNGSYFSLVQPYQHHNNTPTIYNNGINVYSFALKPEEHQPSGTLNMSRIDTAVLSVSSSIAGTISIYATNYNVLRIMSGMGGLAYSN